MPTSQKLPYYPAQLYKGKRWYIGYYVTDPQSGLMKRQVIKWNRIKNLREREREGRQLVRHINEKLARGWNPLIEQDSPQTFRPLAEAFQKFLRRHQHAHKNGNLRPDTLRSYASYISMFEKWCPDYEKAYCVVFTRRLILNFLDFIYYDRDNSARTRNNYLAYFRQIGAFMVENEYLKANPAEGIKSLPTSPKKRVLIPESYLHDIFSHLKKHDPGFYVVCLLEYLTFIRRTELSKLRVKHIRLKSQIIEIPASISKNKKDGQVTILKELQGPLIEHLKGAANSDYLISQNFRPGRSKIDPKKISDRWAALRKELNLPAVYQFYSLKDTGITQMLNSGLPSIVVRDQARHHNISQTDDYAQRHTGANLALLSWASAK